MEFVTEFGMFLLKALTLTIAVVVGVSLVARMFARAGDPERGRLRVDKLNRRLRRMSRALQEKTLTRTAYRRLRKEQKRQDKKEQRDLEEQPSRPRAYVLEFKGDLRASAVESLRREITAVLTVAKPGEEVILQLDSSGGLVHEYGLAASQLMRLREAELPLTVCVDRVAASGGYLMACVADRLLAAPFAVVGSIGVVAMVPNVRRLLHKHDVDVEHHTAGAYKRTLSVFGENTAEGRAKFREQLDESHALFKEFVGRHRGELDLEAVATGEHWYGTQALERGLVDELRTSDELLLARCEEVDLYRLRWEERQNLGSRLSRWVESTAARLAARGLQAAHDRELS
jgi:serine protease SohB